MKIPPSQRLQFAFLTEDDAHLMFELDQDPEVMKYINGGTPTTMEEIRDVYIPRLKKYADVDRGWGIWKVETTQSGDFIGWVLVRPMDFFTTRPDDRDLELGWRFKKESWGQGYATEAAKAIAQQLEMEDQCDRLSAIALPDNDASISIMKKLGMKYVKTETHKDPLGDVVCVYYSKDVNCD